MNLEMKEAMLARVRLSLIDCMNAWLSGADNEGLEFPYTGDNVTAIMADAALAVLRGIDDSQEILIREGMLKP